mgnify:CR=1 FL=1
MIQNAEKDGIPRLAAEEDPRILPVGRFTSRDPSGRVATGT